MTFQALKLKKGETAHCVAGYPKQAHVMVECIKDFSDCPSWINVINDFNDYVVPVSGIYGLLTSHLISSNWTKQ